MVGAGILKGNSQVRAVYKVGNKICNETLREASYITDNVVGSSLERLELRFNLLMLRCWL